ncbi:MAG: FAD-dependent oxidoreductase, partial [Acetobacteraceae bacterium]
MPEIPAAARIVIIGGGIVGCATAYHLARAGAEDVLLLERHRLTAGSTFHAAGLVGQLRSSAAVTRLLGHSVALYRRLEAETGLATGWKMNGGLRLACNQERWSELRRQATTARSFGLEMHLLAPAEAKRLWPLMEADDLVGAAFLPTDGQVNPSDVTAALARGARTAGARILEDCEVTGIEIAGGRPAAVLTREGRIACEIVVNCAGRWAREVGAMAGVTVPLVALRHQYLITEPIPGTPRDLPTLRDPDRLTYYKEEVGGLVAGGYEPDPQNWANDGAPDREGFRLIEPDWDHFQPMMENLIARVPALANAGIRQLLNGPESFTPDGNFILGEAPGLAGFFVGAGFNAFGIAAGGGAGEALAAWILGGEPPFDLWPVDIRRFGRNQADIASVRTRTREMYGHHYAIAFPHAEFTSARPLRRS